MPPGGMTRLSATKESLASIMLSSGWPRFFFETSHKGSPGQCRFRFFSVFSLFFFVFSSLFLFSFVLFVFFPFFFFSFLFSLFSFRFLFFRFLFCFPCFLSVFCFYSLSFRFFYLLSFSFLSVLSFFSILVRLIFRKNGAPFGDPFCETPSFGSVWLQSGRGTV